AHQHHLGGVAPELRPRAPGVEAAERAGVGGGEEGGAGESEGGEQGVCLHGAPWMPSMARALGTGLGYGGGVFPEGFLFGTATSAPRAGAHSPTTDGSASAAEPGRVKTGDAPAVACDGCPRSREAVPLRPRLGMNAHRLSIEWARVEPRPGEIDGAALD